MHVDQQGSIFVPEYVNNRVTKWNVINNIWATSAIVAAGGNGNGSGLNQLDGTLAVTVDQSGIVYAADYGNHRIMRWLRGAQSGAVIAGGQGQGALSTQLNHPYDLTFDRNGNLYVSDFSNHRIQMFAIDKNSCSGELLTFSHELNILSHFYSGTASRSIIANQLLAFFLSLSVLIFHCAR
jgi:hypothetical protein